MIRRSGIGHAMRHQMAALDTQGIEWTLNEKDDYDILHLNTVGVASERIAKKARREGKKIVVHAHSTQEDFQNSFLFSNQMSSLFKKRLMQVYQLGDRIVTPTPYSKRLLEGYGITIPIDAVSNGVDLARFARDERKIAAYRAHFHLEGRKSVICVGLPFERKGIFDFIEVAAQLPEVTFIWFGKVPLYTVPAKIRRIVKGAHPPNVIFPGYVEGDVLEGAYAGADAFQHVSFHISWKETCWKAHMPVRTLSSSRAKRKQRASSCWRRWRHPSRSSCGISRSSLTG